MNFQFSVGMILIFQCVVILTFNYAAPERQNRETQFTIEVKGHYTDTLIEDLRTHDFNLLHKITPSVYIFQYEGDGDTDKALGRLSGGFKDEIVAVEDTREYYNTLRPVYTEQDEADDDLKAENLVCENYYGMGVTKVWERNITGKGVTIAVNDVGINTDLHDLEANIKKSLCINFLTNTSDVTPERFSDLVEKGLKMSDHGNNVASIAASIKDNNICSAGIAYEATIVALKVYKIVHNDSFFDISPNHWTASDIISRSFVYKLDEIDIFANAWGPTTPFDQLDIATRNALTYGATEGRQGLGVIYIVPAGPCGNELSNNIYTISVNSLGRFGSQHDDVVVDSSVLISGLRNGNNLTASSMVTTSFNNLCVTTFKGLSAAVSQIAGIIALGLQTNPNLHLRDVQHLLVQAATHEHLVESIAFRSNGAFRYYHNIFGFGLINADKFVSLAEKHKPVSKMMSLKLTEYSRSTRGSNIQMFEFRYFCDAREDMSCLILIEHVTIKVNFTTDDQLVRMEIVSPSKTSSVLMDLKLYKKETKSGNFVSVHFWDEIAFGKWNIKIQQKNATRKIDVHNITLTLYGTRPHDIEEYAVKNEEEVTTSTETTSQPQPVETGYIIAGVFAALIVLTLIFVLVYCIFIRRRFQRIPQEESRDE